MTRNFVPRTYSPDTFIALEQAFNDVWARLYSHLNDKDMAKDVSINLSRTLADLVTDGVTDVETLKRRALENMVLSC